MDVKDNLGKTKGQKGKSKISGQGSRGAGSVVSNNAKSSTNIVNNARNAQASVVAAATPPTTSSEQLSRDDVVSNLMAMGFAEAG